jgi:NNP family nitrate/nitrite transporter-like MFS transporter
VPFVNGWYPPERQGFALGVYGMGMAEACLPASPPPGSLTAGGLSSPFWVATALLVATCAVFLALARDAPRPQRTAGQAVGMFAALSVFAPADALGR